ncbi:hypothetical protein FM119_10790 [Mycetocola reblochoni REB411]|uniref:Metallopeptidase family protein n=1 Tax=Mycetocola reblochoni REB411 TaxID=1255698 RepID=A0A1R4K1J1_9MICO|nr:hypothetical protein FM119_10790 [Mycetocola reblochoni REB411]
MLGPELFIVGQRSEQFSSIVAGAADYLRGAWEQELTGVAFEVGAMPAAADPDEVPRWWTSKLERRIVLFRVPIERLSRMHRNDPEHRQMLIESMVFRATAEYVGRDPWDLDKDGRYL